MAHSEETVAGDEPAAVSVAQQSLLALYCLQDVMRLAAQGRHVPATWIKRHGLLVGITGDNRKNILRLARTQHCLACRERLPEGSTGDHIIALASGGPAGAENYLPLCGRCNASKGKRDLLDWWHAKGRSATELPPDVLCAYARLAFAQHRRLGTLGEPASAALSYAIGELVGALLDPEQEWMLRQRVSWITGRRW